MFVLRRTWFHWPLAVKMTVTMTLLVVATTVCLTLLSIQRERQTFQNELQGQVQLILDTLASTSADRLYYLDQTFLDDTISTLVKDNIIIDGRFYDSEGRAITDAFDNGVAFQPEADPLGQLLVQHDTAFFEWQADRLLAGRPISAGRARLGAVSISVPTNALAAKMAAVRLQGVEVALAAALLGALLSVFVSRSITRPLRALTLETRKIAGADEASSQQTASRDEVAMLAQAFTTMSRAVRDREQALHDLAASLEQRVSERTAELAQTLAELQETSRARTQLSETIRELSSPVIPILDGVLVMPLIGVIDPERGTLVLQSLLAAVEQHRARMVIIEVTGMPAIDTTVAHMLLNVVRAARLLGAQVILTGLHPELCQTIVSLGIDLSALVTRADLQGAVRYALAEQRA